MDQLPPIGAIPDDQHSEAISFVSGIFEECAESRASFAAVADQSVTVYERGSDDDTSTVYANDIQNAVITVTDVQAKEPPVSSWEPSDTGGKCPVYYVGSRFAPVAASLPPECVSGILDPLSGEQLAPPQPIPEEIVDWLDLQGALTDDLVVRVNAEVIGDYFQTLYDKVWQRSRLDQWFRANVLQTNIAGWQFALYEFDPGSKTAVMTELSVHQAFMDPTVSTLEKAAYFGVDLVVDEGWAKRRYPKLASVLSAEAHTGQPDSPDSTNSLGSLQSVNFRRRMVTMRIAWFRNQPIKLAPEEAIASGQLSQMQIPLAGPEPLPPDAPFSPEEHEAQAQEQVEEVPGQGQILPDADGFEGQGPDAAPVLGPPQPAPQFREVLTHPETGEELTPEHEQWPVRYALRRMVIVNNRIIAADEEEDGRDGGLVHNVAIPIPRKPWGLGEPYRQLQMQKARNRMLGAIVDHCDHNAHPPSLISQGMYDATKGVYEDARTTPGSTLIAPDTQFMQANGKLDVFQTLPPLAEHHITGQQLMKQEISEGSGNTDVLNGRAPASTVKSGKAIELLQGAGASAIELKAMNSGDMVYRLGMLLQWDIWRNFTVEDCLKITRRYPPHIVAHILSEGPRLEWMLSVIIGGGGASRTMKREQDRVDQQAGRISMETYRDRWNIDHKQEEQRITQQIVKQAQMQAMLQPPAPASDKEGGDTGAPQ
jgi:hypothetical protein